MISDMYSMYTIRIVSYHYRAYNLVRSLLHTNIMATPSDKCTPCELCHKSNPKTKHLGQMEKHVHHNVVYRWLKLNKPTISNSACICLPCIKQIQRNHDKPGFSPRWMTKLSIPPKTCNLEHCQGLVHAQTSLVTVDELESHLSTFFLLVVNVKLGVIHVFAHAGKKTEAVVLVVCVTFVKTLQMLERKRARVKLTW